MFELITIARPYAEAAFNFAISYRKVNRWQYMLSIAAEVIENAYIKELLQSNLLTPELCDELFILVCGEKLDQNCQNLIRMMAENSHLNAIPEVLKQFIHLRIFNESIAEVEVISASPLSKKQISKIASVMRDRLSQKVKLSCKIDKSIIAGIIVRSDNVVIDGSVRGRLERLAETLQN